MAVIKYIICPFPSRGLPESIDSIPDSPLPTVPLRTNFALATLRGRVILDLYPYRCIIKLYISLLVYLPITITR